ncbi:MAG: glycosyltransferase family 39 protein, partial [Nocardioides sp.]|nr:glycosyltransferase family 39 protein [Nocardioides sp.]
MSVTIGLPAHPLTRVRTRVSERMLLGTLLGGALLVRLLGVWHGLPQVYNADEELHFVPQAAGVADGHLDQTYLENPSALTMLLAVVLRVIFVGRSVTGLLATDPGAVFLVARVVVALLGTLLTFVVYLAGRRFLSPAGGLVAGAVIGFAFLPVFYSHQALNDVPTMLGITLTLLAALRAYEVGGLRAFVLAGCAIGLATATKYNAAPVALVVVAAWALRWHAHPSERPTRSTWWVRTRPLWLAALASLAVFVVLDPFFVLHLGSGLWQVTHEGSQAGEAKLGQSGSPEAFYPVSLLWGLGVVPTMLAVVGAVAGLRSRRVRTVLLLVFPLVLFAYVCTQGRYFGRWMLPAYPALAVLA